MIEIKALAPEHAEAALTLTKNDFARLGIGRNTKPKRGEIRDLSRQLEHNTTNRFQRVGAFEHVSGQEELVAYIKFGRAIVRKQVQIVDGQEIEPLCDVPELQNHVASTNVARLRATFWGRNPENDPWFLATLATRDGDMGSIAVAQLVEHSSVSLFHKDFYASVPDIDTPTQEWLRQHGAAQAWFIGSTVAAQPAEIPIATISKPQAATMSRLWHYAPREVA